VLRTLEGHLAPVNAVMVTPDGRRAVSASDDQTLKVWNLKNRPSLAHAEPPRFRLRRGGDGGRETCGFRVWGQPLGVGPGHRPACCTRW